MDISTLLNQIVKKYKADRIEPILINAHILHSPEVLHVVKCVKYPNGLLALYDTNDTCIIVKESECFFKITKGFQRCYDFKFEEVN